MVTSFAEALMGAEADALLIDDAMTLISTTTARPIMRVAVVTAVRVALRIALLRASCPAWPYADISLAMWRLGCSLPSVSLDLLRVPILLCTARHGRSGPEVAKWRSS
jgi:hypothetical protein